MASRKISNLAFKKISYPQQKQNFVRVLQGKMLEERRGQNEDTWHSRMNDAGNVVDGPQTSIGSSIMIDERKISRGGVDFMRTSSCGVVGMKRSSDAINDDGSNSSANPL